MLDLLQNPEVQRLLLLNEDGLLFAIWETIYVTVLSTLFSYVIGLPLGVLVVVGEKGGVLPLPKPLMSVINVVIKTHEGMVLVQEENFYEGQRAARDGLLPTTKEDKWYHGFGMRSMRMIVRKYGGEMKVNVSGGIFRLTILFPDAQNK